MWNVPSRTLLVLGVSSYTSNEDTTAQVIHEDLSLFFSVASQQSGVYVPSRVGFPVSSIIFKDINGSLQAARFNQDYLSNSQEIPLGDLLRASGRTRRAHHRLGQYVGHKFRGSLISIMSFFLLSSCQPHSFLLVLQLYLFLLAALGEVYATDLAGNNYECNGRSGNFFP